MTEQERQKIVDKNVAMWTAIERNAMPAFFKCKEGLDTYDLYHQAMMILKDASFLTPHYMHGWAVGVEGRKFYPEKSLKFDNEFEIGYITGWCQMDEALKKEGIE